MSLKVAIGPSSFGETDSRPINLLEAAGVQVVPNPFGRRLTEDEIIAHLEGVDGLIAGLEPLNRRVLTSASQLKAIARVGIGVDNVDFDVAEELDVRVSNTPDGPTSSVAEMTITSMLALTRRLIESNSLLHAGRWEKLIGSGLRDTPVLLIGYGRIGQAVAALLDSFGAKVLIYDPYLEDGALRHGETRVSLEEGLGEARIVTLHASGDETILDAEAFDMMQDGVMLLNSARAGLVDESALGAALHSGKVGGAWFDTFWQEPYSGELQGQPNVLLTPHIGTYTKQCRLSMETEAVGNLLRDLGVQTPAVSL